MAPIDESLTVSSASDLHSSFHGNVTYSSGTHSTMILAWSEHELVISHPLVRRCCLSQFGDAFCIGNYSISRSGYLLKFHQMLRLPRKVTLQHHQMLRLPPKLTLHDTATSPNTVPATSRNAAAPATINDSHDWSCSHMKRHWQCAEQPHSPSNVSKNRACHEKWLSWLIPVTYETSFTMHGATGSILQPHQILRLPRKVALPNAHKSKRNLPKTVEASFTMRGRFNHDPNMRSFSHPLVRRGYFSQFGDAFCIGNYSMSRSGYLPKFHQMLPLPRKVTLQHHQMLRLPRTTTSPISAPATKSDPANAAPATKNDSHDWSRSHMKRHLQCAEQPHSELLTLWTVTWLSCCFTQLLLYWTVTLLNCYLTDLLLDWTVTWLNRYFTERLLLWILYIFKSP